MSDLDEIKGKTNETSNREERSNRVFYYPIKVCTNLYEVNEYIKDRNAVTISDTDGVFQHLSIIPFIKRSFKDGASAFLGVMSDKKGLAIAASNRKEDYPGTEEIRDTLKNVYDIPFYTYLNRQTGEGFLSGFARDEKSWTDFKSEVLGSVQLYIDQGHMKEGVVQLDFIYDTYGPGTFVRNAYGHLKEGYRQLINKVWGGQSLHSRAAGARDALKAPLKNSDMLNRIFILESKFMEDLSKHILDKYPEKVKKVYVQRIEIPKMFTFEANSNLEGQIEQ